MEPKETVRAILLVNDLRRYAVDIAGISEVRWLKRGETTVDGYRFVYCGKERERQAGVALVLSPRAQAALRSTTIVSERLIMARFKSQHGYTTVMQVYAPTDAASQSEKQAFYTALQGAMSRVPRHDMLLVLGDFNARVGNDHRTHGGGVVGHHGLPGTTENGEMLLDFCALNRLVVTNTLFAHKRAHKVTWLAPAGSGHGRHD